MIATILAAVMLQVQDTTQTLGPATIYGESKRQLFKFIISYAGTIIRLFCRRIAGGFGK